MNRLSLATSPYLLQHAHNPVDWFEWGEEAFAKARSEDKPIFLSIGYAACHWCHVMERESFEDKSVAAYLNEHFVAIKVDREERPDVDDVYMTTVQMMTGAGGWPLSIFLLPDLRPFYGGTYYPPEDRYGRPGFKRLLEMIADAWVNRREEVEKSAGQLTDGLKLFTSRESTSGDLPTLADVDQAVTQVASSFDPMYGGFGPAPKFPPTGQLAILLEKSYRDQKSEIRNQKFPHLEMVERTLTRMAAGGIFDQLGGGFARYSTDAEWLTPHFEKMLYDNALLSVNYIDAGLATGKQEYFDVAERTLAWALREMRDEAGGFHSSLDADSEGEEGKFYVWMPEEIKSVLGDDDGQVICDVYGVDEGGNFEHGTSILHQAMPLKEAVLRYGGNESELAERLSVLNEKLFHARENRIRPGKDDKVLTDWNSLMISALARGARALEVGAKALEGEDRAPHPSKSLGGPHSLLGGNPSDQPAAQQAVRLHGRQTGTPILLRAAQEVALFIRDNMWVKGRLMHSWRQGKIGAEGLLDDHTYYLAALLDLYQADFDETHIAEAERVASELRSRFWDEEDGGFFTSPAGRADLINRPKSGRDGATPSGNGIAASALLTLYQLTDKDEYRDLAERTVKAFAGSMKANPAGHLRLAIAAQRFSLPTIQVAVVGEPGSPMVRNLLQIINSWYLPDLVVASDEERTPGVSLLKDRSLVDGKAAAYVCRDFVCNAPVTEPEELARLLDGSGAPLEARNL